MLLILSLFCKTNWLNYICPDITQRFYLDITKYFQMYLFFLNFKILLTLSQRKEQCPTCFYRNAAATDMVMLTPRGILPAKVFDAEIFSPRRHLKPVTGCWALSQFITCCVKVTASASALSKTFFRFLFQINSMHFFLNEAISQIFLHISFIYKH